MDGGLTISVIHQVPQYFSSRTVWLGVKDLNLQLPESESGALPIELTPNINGWGGRVRTYPTHGVKARGPSY